MTAGPIDPHLIEQARREINRLLAEVEQLAQRNLPPGEFYAQYCQRVLTALAAQAVCIWLKPNNSNSLQLAYQINLAATGIVQNEAMQRQHKELTDYAAMQTNPITVAPQSGSGPDLGLTPLLNPTDFLLVMAPIIVEETPMGLVEVFIDPSRREGVREAHSQQNFARFLARMADEAAKYFKNRQYRLLVNQEKMWNQVEGFARSVHGALNPKEVAYLIANEGRKLVQCERLSVAVRRGGRTTIEAISGQDTVEKRSNLVRQMGALADRVLVHGENLVYVGEMASHWPGDTVQALERYLAESNNKLLLIMPLTDQRDYGDRRDKPAVALIVEMIEDAAEEPEEMAGRVEVVGRHGGGAMYNALDHHRIFLLPFWKTLGSSSEWFSAYTMPKIVAALALIFITITILVFMPWPLRLEGKGELVPEVRRQVYAPVDGRVENVAVKQGEPIHKGRQLATMASIEIDLNLIDLQAKRDGANEQLNHLRSQSRTNANNKNKDDLAEKMMTLESEVKQLDRQIQIERVRQNDLKVFAPISGKVMDWKPVEKLLNRPVKQGDPLFEVADVDGEWILEVDFPENAAVHISRAREDQENGRLPITFVLISEPDTTYRGEIYEVSSMLQPVEQENVVRAKIRIHPDDVEKLPRTSVQTAGNQVRVRADCGPHALGYVLFRELIDFVRCYVFF